MLVLLLQVTEGSLLDQATSYSKDVSSSTVHFITEGAAFPFSMTFLHFPIFSGTFPSPAFQCHLRSTVDSKMARYLINLNCSKIILAATSLSAATNLAFFLSSTLPFSPSLSASQMPTTYQSTWIECFCYLNSPSEIGLVVLSCPVLGEKWGHRTGHFLSGHVLKMPRTWKPKCLRP